MADTVAYGDGVPKTLRAACDRAADRVAEVIVEPGIDSPSGYAYSITTRYGWCFYPGAHRELADTARDGLRALRQIAECACDDCLMGLAGL